MGNYIVSARKYRPKDFEEVVGQDHITTTLKNAIDQDQLAQALLFCGPRGVGKTTCARIVANMINGFNQTSEGSSTALNIYELDAASNNSVDDIRNLIDQVRYPPQYGRYKVYIIDEVHMLSNQAFNAFLKTLEEPPPYAIFILATTEKHKVIPTILSRCQIFDFNRIRISDITDRLHLIAENEHIKTDPEALHLIALKADGALRDALSLFDLIVTYAADNTVTYKNTAENLHILDYDYYFGLTDYFIDENLSGSLLTFNEILKKGFDGQHFIIGLAEHFRNLLVCKDEATIDLLEVSEGIKIKYLEQSKLATKSFLLSALNITNQCDLNFKSSNNQRLHVEITLMKLTHLNSSLKISDLITSNPEVKKKFKAPQLAKKDVESKPQEEKSVMVEENLPQSKDISVDSRIKDKDTQKKKTLKIPSIDALKSSSASVPEIEKVQKNKEISAENRNNIFTKDELEKTWKKFADQFKISNKSNEFNLMAKSYSLDEDHQIEIIIDNAIEEDIFDRFKSDLIIYLRDSLKNDSIKVITKRNINTDSNSKKIYTNTDKFNYLAEKNPYLIDLKNTLGFDTDF